MLGPDSLGSRARLRYDRTVTPHRAGHQSGFAASLIVPIEPEDETNVNVTQTELGEAKPDRLRTRVNLALLCVFLVFAILWGLLLWFRFAQSTETGERRAENLALILSEHL